MIGKVTVTSSGYDPDGPRVNDPTLGPEAERHRPWRCRRCGTTRPKADWPTRYGIIECGTCLPQGYVGLLEPVEG